MFRSKVDCGSKILGALKKEETNLINGTYTFKMPDGLRLNS